mgnify:CR=1 FL=1
MRLFIMPGKSCRGIRKVLESLFFLLSKCAFLLPFAAICAVLILLYVSVISVYKMQILVSIPGDSEPPFRRHSTAVPF